MRVLLCRNPLCGVVLVVVRYTSRVMLRRVLLCGVVVAVVKYTNSIVVMSCH